MTGTTIHRYLAVMTRYMDGDLVIGDDFGTDCWTKHYRAIADLNPAIKALNDGKLTTTSQEDQDHSDGTGKIPQGMELFHAGTLLWRCTPYH